MKRTIYTTIIAVIVIFTTQSLHISHTYDHYKEEVELVLVRNTYYSIDSERNIRLFGTESPSFPILTEKNIGKNVMDSIKKVNPQPPMPVYNMKELKEKGIVNPSSNLTLQISQDTQYDKGNPLNVIVLDSLFTTLDENNLSTNFVLIDNLKGKVKQSKQQDTTKYRYKSKIFPIGISDKQTVQVYYDIPLPSFIKASIWSLVVSIATMILMVVTFIIMLRELQRKHKVLKNVQDDIKGTVHDLRSPLAGIITSLNVVEDLLPPTTKSLIEKCVSAADHLIKRIDMLLTFSMPSKNNEQNKEIVRNKEIINTYNIILNDINNLYVKNQIITLSNKINNETTLYINLSQLDSIIRNLVENSVKYSDNGVSINVDLEIRNNTLIISVTDDGWGIDKKQCKLIFKKYYKVSNNDKSSRGFGVGLYQVERIVKANGGSINVESVVGKGSRFKVVIPCD